MENKRLYGLICYLQREMSRENNTLFAENGITPIQMQVLVFVMKQTKTGKSVCQKDIEKYVNIRASSMSTLLSTLEKSGFILRTVSDGDARTKYVTLTEKGKTICIKNKMLMEKCDGLIQSALSEDEQETFKNLLNKIISEIENSEKGGKKSDQNTFKKR